MYNVHVGVCGSGCTCMYVIVRVSIFLVTSSCKDHKANTLYFVELGLGLRLGNISHKWASSFRDSLHEELTSFPP